MIADLLFFCFLSDVYCFFFFFLDESGQRFIKFIFSKNQLIVFIHLFYCFYTVSSSFISALIVMIVFSFY